MEQNSTPVRGQHGGARPGAGRKPKAQEIALIEKLDQYIDTDIVANRLFDLIDGEEVREGTRLEAIKLYMNYRFGKPKEQKEVSITQEQPIFELDLTDVILDDNDTERED